VRRCPGKQEQLHNRTSDQENVNDARKWLFTKKIKEPMQATLRQHIKPVANCWSEALIPNPELPRPSPGHWE